MCIFWKTEKQFTRYPDINKIKDVIFCPTTCVDGVNTFNFGIIANTYEPDACEARCYAKLECHTYVFFTSSYVDKVWAGYCVGISYETGVNVNEPNVFSGVLIDGPILGKFTSI